MTIPMPLTNQNRSASPLALEVCANQTHRRVILRFCFVLRARKSARMHCNGQEVALLSIMHK